MMFVSATYKTKKIVRQMLPVHAMQPSPMADTSGPFFPKCLYFIYYFSVICFRE